MFPDRFRGAARALLCAAAGFLLAACAAPAPPPPPPPPPPPALAPPPPPRVVVSAPVLVPAPPPAVPDPVALAEQARRRDAELITAMLAYADRVRTMTPPELGLETARLGGLPDAVRSAAQDTQLSIALAQSHLPSDTARAQQLLQRVLAHPGAQAQALAPFARLLAARLLEQKRVEDALERQAAQAREQQRRIDQLTERLEAVRALERSLTTRGGRMPSP